MTARIRVTAKVPESNGRTIPRACGMMTRSRPAAPYRNCTPRILFRTMEMTRIPVPVSMTVKRYNSLTP